MADDPISVLSAYLAAADTEDYERLAELLASDVVVHQSYGDTTEGFPIQQELWEETHAGFSDVKHEIAHAISDGQWVSARITHTSVHTGEFRGFRPLAGHSTWIKPYSSEPRKGR